MGMLSYNGQPTGVIYGYLYQLLKLSQRFQPKYFITTWDGGRTHREKDYAPYKQHRKDKRTPQQKADRKGMIEQSLVLRNDVLPEMGLHKNYWKPFYEADDIIAYWVERLHRKHNYDIIVVSNDSDMYQLLDRCRVYNLTKKKTITIDTFRKQYGIEPYQWPMAKAIGGCETDGVIGIAGVSDPKKTTSKATKYLRGEITSGKIYDAITSKQGKEVISRNLPIVTIPYRPEDIGHLITRRNNPSRKKFLKVFDKYRFISFLKEEKFAEWKKVFNLI